jgi:DNA modification methylase
MASNTILIGDCLTTLRTLPDGAAQTCVTSPPYYGLRDYGVAGQIGLEETPDAYVARLVDVFREVRRVLRDDGTLWLNLGDSYARSEAKGGSGPGGKNCAAYGNVYGLAQSAKVGSSDGAVGRGDRPGSRLAADGVKYKDLLGIPWMVAFALRADGWWLRSDIIWHKPNPMPESVRDRPTSAHEHVFLLSKRASYFYDAAAIAEPADFPGDDRHNRTDARKVSDPMCADGGSRARTGNPTGLTRNARNVWTIATQPYSGAHFATMPPDLAERCIKAGSRPGDTVLDPFSGAGTTGLVADRLNRDAILCELNPEYARLARERIKDDAPLFAGVA